MQRTLTLFLAIALSGSAVAGAQIWPRSSPGVRAQRVMLIPVRPPMPLPTLRPADGWKEHRGPRCIDRVQVAGAALSGPGRIDLMLRDRTRLSARLETSCPALDYYNGFYLKPTPDGRICENRDAFHLRTGGECGIERFKTLRRKAVKPSRSR